MLPLSDEQAKLGQQIVSAAREASAWLSDTAGDLPRDAVGMLGDWVKVKRAEFRLRCVRGARERLRARGVSSAEEPSPKILLPLLEAAENEDSEGLQDLWSRLLAAAMDPNRKDGVRQSFIVTIKQLDPIDGLVLREIQRQGNTPWVLTGQQGVAKTLRCSHAEVVVSIQNLTKLDLVAFSDANGSRHDPRLTAFGELFLNAVSD